MTLEHAVARASPIVVASYAKVISAACVAALSAQLAKEKQQLLLSRYNALSVTCNVLVPSSNSFVSCYPGCLHC